MVMTGAGALYTARQLRAFDCVTKPRCSIKGKVMRAMRGNP
jgi:hypothetical protein